MRKVLVTILALSLSAALAPAFALQANDTMKSWKNAPAKERAELLDRLLGKPSGAAAGIRKCLDETSNIPGHTDLRIGDIVKACGASKDADQPV